MRIYVDGKEAVLKAGSTFEYVSENPLFAEAEGYSLEIEFPLNDCPENILIFGALHVKGVDIKKVTFPCVLDAGTFRKSGFLKIVEVNDVEVKGQFLEGMSTEKYEFDALGMYIDEMDFTGYDGTDGNTAFYNYVSEDEFVNLVVWDKQDDAIFNRKGFYGFLHPKLQFLLELILLDLAGVDDYDISALTSIPWFSKLVIVNTTAKLRQVNKIDDDHENKGFMYTNMILPHWTVKEFLDEIAKFFGCNVAYDMINRKITFIPLNKYVDEAEEVEIIACDDYKIEVEEGEGKYSQRGKYKLPDECNPDGINMCPGLENFMGKVTVKAFVNPSGRTFEWMANNYSTDNYFNEATAYLHSPSSPLSSGYVKIVEKITKDGVVGQFITFERVNQYGNFLEGDELKIVPCNLEIKRFERWYGMGPDGEIIINEGDISIPYKMPVIDIQKPKAEYNFSELVEAVSKNEDVESKYNKLYLVIYDSSAVKTNGYHLNTKEFEPIAGTVYPEATKTALVGDVPTYHKDLRHYSYTLSPVDQLISGRIKLLNIDESQLYRYKFLGTTIPSPTSVFLINGQKFACLRITAHFTPSGMSDLLEGEFYRIID